MRYEAVIGLELHIQLNTQSKLFSSSANTFGESPNKQVNELDLGYPGVLPVLNKQALHHAALLGLALGARVNQYAFFMRKNYFYPDLPKGYQISQLDDAIIQGGEVQLDSYHGPRKIRINRGQLEEDAGKSVHDAFSDYTGIDLNRAGVPLIELVTEPDMRSAREAADFMRQIHHLVRYLGISDGNMQEGSLRCDANISIREPGSDVLNNRVELKNINSFRFVEQAINIEIARQSELFEQGETVHQETRLFDATLQETRVMRSKEQANDYRYFPDPDLLPLNLSKIDLDGFAAELPELPAARSNRLRDDYKLDDESVAYILQDRATADYFDALVDSCADARLAANWMQREFAHLLNEMQSSIEKSRISSAELGLLLSRIADNTISAKAAKKLLPEMWKTGQSVDELIALHNLKQVNDDSAIVIWIEEILAQHPQQVLAYQGGQKKMLGFFVGQVLKRSKGQANPQLVSQLLQEKLDG